MGRRVERLAGFCASDGRRHLVVPASQRQRPARPHQHHAAAQGIFLPAARSVLLVRADQGRTAAPDAKSSRRQRVMPCSACVPATAPARCAWTRCSTTSSRTTTIRRAAATWPMSDWPATSRKASTASASRSAVRRCPPQGMDVLMTDLGDRYFVAAVTETGKALMAAGRQSCSPNRVPPTRNN